MILDKFIDNPKYNIMLLQHGICIKNNIIIEDK